MSSRPSELPQAQRQAFGALFKTARLASGMTWPDMAFAVTEPGSDPPDHTWWQWLESGPPRPLSNIPRLSATMRVLKISWPQVLTALDAWVEYRDKPVIDLLPAVPLPPWRWLEYGCDCTPGLVKSRYGLSCGLCGEQMKDYRDGPKESE